MHTASYTISATNFQGGGSLYYVVPGYRGDVLGWAQLVFAYRDGRNWFSRIEVGRKRFLRIYEGFICNFAVLRRAHFKMLLIYGGLKKSPCRPRTGNLPNELA